MYLAKNLRGNEPQYIITSPNKFESIPARSCGRAAMATSAKK